MTKHSTAILAALLAAASIIAGPACTARGDDGKTIDGAVIINPDPAANAPYLAPVYKDETAGFRLAPPAGSKISSHGGIDLMSFVVDARYWGGDLELLNLTDPISLDDYTKNASAELSKTFKGLQILGNQPVTLPSGFKAVKFSLSMEGELGTGLPTGVTSGVTLGKTAPGVRAAPVAGTPSLVSLMRQQLIVQMAPSKFMVLTFWTPLKDREVASRTFDAMLGSFEIFNAEEMRHRRNLSNQAGLDWLAKVAAEQYKAKFIPQPQFFRMTVGGVDVGYIRFDEGDKETKNGQQIDVIRDGNRGVLLEMNSRSFPADGSIVKAQSLMFWANSHGPKGEQMPFYSTWETNSARIIKGPVAQPGQPAANEFFITEAGIVHGLGQTHFTPEQIQEIQKARADEIDYQAKLPPERRVVPPELDLDHIEQYRLQVTLGGDHSQQLPPGINTSLPPVVAPLPKILEFIWPRLVDLTKPSEMSFWVYNSQTDKIALRTLIGAGKDQVKIDGKLTNCYKCIDQLDPGSTTIWVDETGRILMMCTSDQTVLTRTTEAEMVKRWGDRLKAEDR